MVFGAQKLLPVAVERYVIYVFGLSTLGLESGMVWQFFTHAFLHGSVWHLVVNMMALWFAGLPVEFVLGRWRLLMVYFCSAFGGGILQMMLGEPGVDLIGASGAVCGVLLSFATIYWNREVTVLLFFVVPLRLQAKFLGIGIIGVSVVAIVFQIEPWIGHAAHLGGALTGWLFTKGFGFAGRRR